MSLVKSSFYDAILLVAAFTSTWQKTAAQAVLCGQFEEWNSTSGQYMIQNNAWGADGSGSQCTTVEESLDGTTFWTTWTWKANQTKVHSYANIKSTTDTLPVMLSNIGALNVSANWTMYPSATGNPTLFDIDGLNAIGAKSDVTLDFFLDPDEKQSLNVTDPKYEVMIWFAALGDTEPLGYANGSIGGTLVDGMNYTLFEGYNTPPKSQVFSFVAPENMTSISLDVLPLFQYLVESKRMPSSTYLGTAQFGSEAMHSNGENVTFEATGIDLNIETKAELHAKPPAKSTAVSLQEVLGFKWRCGLLEFAIGALLFLSWVL